jgi:hypothetical protein
MRWHPLSSAGVALPSAILGMGLGCGPSYDQPKLAPTPPGVELLKPGPPPKVVDPTSSGYSEKARTQAPSR